MGRPGGGAGRGRGAEECGFAEASLSGDGHGGLRAKGGGAGQVARLGRAGCRQLAPLQPFKRKERESA